MPNLTWYGSPNFAPGRTDVEYVVIHWMDGYLAGADATFQNTVRQTSAHYGVEDDTIHQYVDEANTAWHAGNYDANTRSIGIEHSAMPGRPASDATYASTIWLITGICQRYGLDPAVAILPHQHFTSTDCPGTMDLQRIIAGVQASLGGVSAQSGTITPIPAIQGFLMALSDQDQTNIYQAITRIDAWVRGDKTADIVAPTANAVLFGTRVDGRNLIDFERQTLASLDTVSAKIGNVPAQVLNQTFALPDGTKTNLAGILGAINAKPATAGGNVTTDPAAVVAAIKTQWNK